MTFQASPFLSLLPLEIRLQIYSEVLSSHTIPLHLTNDGSALTTSRDFIFQKLLSLPLTCHQMYAPPPLLNPTNKPQLSRDPSSNLRTQHLHPAHHHRPTLPLPPPLSSLDPEFTFHISTPSPALLQKPPHPLSSFFLHFPDRREPKRSTATTRHNLAGNLHHPIANARPTKLENRPRRPYFLATQLV